MKCEWQNLTGTPKTRLVSHRISRLEHEGILNPGMTLCDVSTGSEAAALAQFGALKGHSVEVWLPNYATPLFVEYLQRFGAKVHLVKGKNWLSEGAQKARATAGRSKNGFYFNQADALEDAVAAYSVLGQELASDLKSRNVQPAVLVSVIGSGGLLLGTAIGLRESFPKTKIIAIELDTAPILHATLYHYEPKIKSPHVWGISSEGSTRMKRELAKIVDEVVLVSEKEMKQAVGRIPKELGISVDYPSASNLLVAERLVKQAVSPVATIWTGHGWRTLCR